MTVRKEIHRKIRRSRDGVNVAADIDAVVSANVGKRGGRNVVTSKSSVRVVQRGRKSEVVEERDPGDDA